MKSNQLHVAKLVVDASRKMSNEGFVIGTWGNVSSRLEEGFIVTPSGMSYDEMTSDDMVVVDLNGELVEGKWKPSTETPLHAAIYQARDDVNAIFHTHSVFASAVAVTRRGIPPIIEDLVQVVGGAVNVAPYALSGTERLRQNVVKLLSDRNAILIANHGVVGVGRDVNDAWMVCKIVEKSAKILVYSKMLGAPVTLDKSEVDQLRKFFLNNYGQR